MECPKIGSKNKDKRIALKEVNSRNVKQKWFAKNGVARGLIYYNRLFNFIFIVPHLEWVHLKETNLRREGLWF